MPHDGGKHIHDKQEDVLWAVTPSTDEGLGRSARHSKGSGRKRAGSDARMSLRAQPTPGRQMMAAVDAGAVCQNINLFCAAAGLATVPRASMDMNALKQILKLTENQLPLMNNPVGYFKK